MDLLKGHDCSTTPTQTQLSTRAALNVFVQNRSDSRKEGRKQD